MSEKEEEKPTEIFTFQTKPLWKMKQQKKNEFYKKKNKKHRLKRYQKDVKD